MKFLTVLILIFSFQLPIFSNSSNDYKVDVVIIGAGGAGLSAAIEAHDLGASVLIVEKMSFVGGNTLRSKGGLNASETSVQKSKNIKDSILDFYNDTMKGGKNINNPELVDYLTKNSAETIDWLTNIGMDVQDVGLGAGAINPRMHRPAGGPSIGGILVKTLFENIKKRKIPVFYNTTATKLLQNNGEVVGIQAINTKNDSSPINIRAKSVIIATGGFAANEEMYSKYRKDLKGFISTNHPGADGSGILLAQDVGSATVDMEQIQTNPTVEQKRKEVISESIRGNGAIFINNKGLRFVNEMETRDKLSNEILKQPEKFSYLIFDESLRNRMKAVEEMEKIGILITAKDLDELGKKLSIEPNTLAKTISTWNFHIKNKSDIDFNRTTGINFPIEKAPFYAIPVAPGVHHTMGGIKINSKTEVIDENNNIIKNLYAAGEVTGGVHGANRLGGNAVADIIIFGRQAGIQSVNNIPKKQLISKNNSIIIEEKEALEINKNLKPKYKNGKYVTSGNGHYGKVRLEIIVEDGFIKNIIPLENNETEVIFHAVKKEIIPKIIYNQDVKGIDYIAGATVSSRAVLSGVNKFIKKSIQK